MRIPQNKNPLHQKFARNLRKNSTDAEQKLWSILRDRQLSGFKFRRQHPMSGFILDFYCLAKRVAIELDGGQRNEPQAVEYDSRRTSELKALGIDVLRFWDDEILKSPDVVAENIYNYLVDRRPSP